MTKNLVTSLNILTQKTPDPRRSVSVVPVTATQVLLRGEGIFDVRSALGALRSVLVLDDVNWPRSIPWHPGRRAAGVSFPKEKCGHFTGKHTKKTWKITMRLMGKLTIAMAIFNSYVCSPEGRCLVGLLQQLKTPGLILPKNSATWRNAHQYLVGNNCYSLIPGNTSPVKSTHGHMFIHVDTF